jgi:WD40 repeat protein
VTVVREADRQVVACLPTQRDVWALAFTPDGKRLVASYWGTGALEVWDLASQRVVFSLAGHAMNVWKITFSADGKMMATAASDETVRLWDVATWQTSEILRGHGREVWSAAFTPDGKCLASGGTDFQVMLWVTHPQRVPEIITDVWDEPVFSPDGLLLATTGSNNCVTLRATASMQPIEAIRDPLRPLGFSSDSRVLVCLSEHPYRIIRWDVASRSVQSRIDLACEAPLESAVLSRDGTKLITVGGAGSETGTWKIRVWDASTGVLLGCLQDTSESGAVDFSPDGKWIASIRWDDALVWNADTLELATTLQRQSMWLTDLTFSSDSRLLATGSGDGTVVLWDLDAKKDIGVLSGHPEAANGLSLSPDGKTLADYSGGVVTLWNLSVLREVAKFNHDEVAASTFSPDGCFLAIRDQHRLLHLMRAPSWEEIAAAEKADKR